MGGAPRYGCWVGVIEMYESDLARPVIEIRDFLSKELEYEMYTYGEQTVVIPVTSKRKKKVLGFEEEIKSLVKKPVIKIKDNKAIIKVRGQELRNLIGKKGDRIRRLEKKYGLSIEVIKK